MKLDVILDPEIGVVLERRVIKIERYLDQALTVTMCSGPLRDSP